MKKIIEFMWILSLSCEFRFILSFILSVLSIFNVREYQYSGNKGCLGYAFLFLILSLMHLVYGLIYMDRKEK